MWGGDSLKGQADRTYAVGENFINLEDRGITKILSKNNNTILPVKSPVNIDSIFYG